MRSVALYNFRLLSFSLIRRHDLKSNFFTVYCTYRASIPVKILGLRHFSSSIAGIKRYDNADTQRLEILCGAKNRVFIYDKVNGNKYIGSSVNLHKRFQSYTHANMNVCDALLKYGYSKFSLFIIEYKSL